MKNTINKEQKKLIPVINLIILKNELEHEVNKLTDYITKNNNDDNLLRAFKLKNSASRMKYLIEQIKKNKPC